MKNILFALLILFLITLPVLIFPQDWSKDDTVIEEYLPENVTLNTGGIESLLNEPLTLTDCLAIALKNNIQLQIDRLEYNRVYQSKHGARQSFLPDLTVAGERQKTTVLDSTGATAAENFDDKIDVSLTEKVPLGGTISFTHDLSWNTNRSDRPTDKPSRLWTLTFSQPLLKGFGFDIGYSDVVLADLDYQIEEFRLHDAVQNTIFLVKEAYLEVLTQKKFIVATEGAIERSQQLKDISLAKVEAKLATRRDVLSADIILAQDKSDQIDAQRKYEDALDILKNVIGVDHQHHITMAIDTLTFTPITIKEEEWLQLAMERNSTIKLQEMVLEKGDFEVKLARSNRLPDLALEGVVSRLDDRDFLRDSRRNDIIGRITLSYPILNLNNRAEHQRAKIAKRQTERTLENTRRDVLLAVRASIRNLRIGAERIEILRKNINASKEKITFSTTMFNLGRASNLDITDAQKDLLDAEVDYAQELSDFYLEQARLEQLLGGHPIINYNPRGEE